MAYTHILKELEQKESQNISTDLKNSNAEKCYNICLFPLPKTTALVIHF